MRRAPSGWSSASGLLLRVTRSFSAARGFVIGAAIGGIGTALTGIAPVLAIAIGFQLVRGLGTALVETNLQTLLQRSVERPMLGRVFANVFGAVNISAAVSVVLGGLLLDATSPGTVLVLAGLLAIAASIVAALLLRATQRGAEEQGALGSPP